MRIVYLNKTLMDSSLPAVNFSFNNAYGLADAGCECYLIAQKKSADFTPEILFHDFDVIALDNFNIRLFQKRKRFGIHTNQWFYLDAFEEIKKLHAEKAIDAVISRDPGALPYMARLRRKTGIHVFYQPHNFYVDLSLRPDVNPKNAKKYHLLEKKFIPKMNGLLCLQDSQAEWYGKYFPAQKIFAAKPGLLKIVPTHDDGYRNRVIGYIGSLQLKKGVDLLLTAFSALRDKNYSLVLVGGRNSAEIEPVARRVRELGLDEQVEITGWLPFSEVEKYLDRISVGIIPLQDIFYNRYLTAPNKLFDYLSRGIPIVARDLPAIRDFMKNGEEGILYDREDPADITNAIEKIFANKSDYSKYSNNALAKAKEYLWKTRAARMLDRIRETIADG